MELSLILRRAAIGIAATVTTLAFALPTYAQSHQGGEANLQLPDLDAGDLPQRRSAVIICCCLASSSACSALASGWRST